MSLIVRAVSPAELDPFIPELTTLLRETVNTDVPLGFLAPISDEDARNYWHRLQNELRSGTRILVVATDEGRVVGSGQLAWSTVPNGHHRAEIQKLFVDSAIRGRGIGRRLMDELHAAARRLGRPLVVLQTRMGLPAVKFYRELGYIEAGVIPGYSIDANGRRYDTVTFYQQLPPDGDT
jgi:ribosomal protein S18 acetylase RimI-like enzyme